MSAQTCNNVHTEFELVRQPPDGNAHGGWWLPLNRVLVAQASKTWPCQARALTVACEGCDTGKLVGHHPSTNRNSDPTRPRFVLVCPRTSPAKHSAPWPRPVRAENEHKAVLEGFFVRMRCLVLLSAPETCALLINICRPPQPPNSAPDFEKVLRPLPVYGKLRWPGHALSRTRACMLLLFHQPRNMERRHIAISGAFGVGSFWCLPFRSQLAIWEV